MLTNIWAYQLGAADSVQVWTRFYMHQQADSHAIQLRTIAKLSYFLL